MTDERNPVTWFEIPVTDLDRAMQFYADALGCDFETAEVDGNTMALFAFDPGGPGASGALARGDSYVPGRTGTLVYFATDDIDAVLARVTAAGRAVLYPKTRVGAWGHVAEFEDSEGNRVGLHQA